jgi:hypothetical protein
MATLSKSEVARLRAAKRRLLKKGYTPDNALQKVLFDNGHLNYEEMLKVLRRSRSQNPHGRKRGKMPKALAKYWRTHKRSKRRTKNPHRKIHAKRRGAMPPALARYWRLHRIRGKSRRSNPSGERERFVVKARKGATGVVMAWNGEKFSGHVDSAARFHSLSHAVAAGQLLREKYPVLKKYHLWADREGSSATP